MSMQQKSMCNKNAPVNEHKFFILHSSFFTFFENRLLFSKITFSFANNIVI